MSGVYHLGATVELSGTFTVDAVGTDPTMTTLTVEAPDGVTSTPPVTDTGAGTWKATFVVDKPGLWHWRLVGTGTAAAIDEGVLYVRRSAF